MLLLVPLMKMYGTRGKALQQHHWIYLLAVARSQGRPRARMKPACQASWAAARTIDGVPVLSPLPKILTQDIAIPDGGEQQRVPMSDCGLCGPARSS